MFSFIGMNWKGEPLVGFETVVKMISATKTRQGLRVKAVLDKNRYEIGMKISLEQMKSLNVKPHKQNPEWNYSLLPRTSQSLSQSGRVKWRPIHRQRRSIRPEIPNDKTKWQAALDQILDSCFLQNLGHLQHERGRISLVIRLRIHARKSFTQPAFSVVKLPHEILWPDVDLQTLDVACSPGKSTLLHHLVDLSAFSWMPFQELPEIYRGFHRVAEVRI
jgi:hypothetical protein